MTDLNIDEATYEMEKSKEIIENKLNEKIDSFSFPFGNFNSKLLKIAKKLVIVKFLHLSMEFHRITIHILKEIHIINY